MKITIQGSAMEGRTAVARLLYHRLLEFGLEVTLEDDDTNPEDVPHARYDNLDAMRQKGVKVRIETIRTPRKRDDDHSE